MSIHIHIIPQSSLNLVIYGIHYNMMAVHFVVVLLTIMVGYFVLIITK